MEKSIGLKSFFQLILKTNIPKMVLAIAILLSLLQTAAGLVVPLATRDLIDNLSLASFDQRILFFLAGAIILQAVSSGFSHYLLSLAGQRMVADLRTMLWRKVLSLTISFFDLNRSGETMSRITNDTNLMMALIRDHLITFFANILMVIGAFTILLYLDWQMTLIIVGAVLLSMGILMPVGRFVYKISKKQQSEMASLTGSLTQVLSEIRLVKAYTTEQKEENTGTIKIENIFLFGMKEAKLQAALSPFFMLVMMSLMVLIIGFGGMRVASGILTTGELVAFILLLFQISMPFTQFAGFYTQLQKVLGATERIHEIFAEEGETNQVTLEAPNGNFDIELNHIEFTYQGEEKVLKDVYFKIPARKVTAIVGPSGSGKTTLFSILERFYTPTSGSILYDQVDIANYSLSSWRRKIGYVSQESPLMAGTIKENITYGIDREISMEQLVHAAEMAYAQNFIDELPERYDTEVGERGMKLSGGQRQRIAIARALLRDPDILMLDEATSSLDSFSESEVQKALLNLMEGRTTIVIAHRLSTVVDSDQIVVLEKGNITGIGTHQELVIHNPTYKELAQKQFQTNK